MNTDRDKLVKEIFADALEKADAAERAVYLLQACGNDAQVRQQVDALLQAHEKAGAFLEQPPVTSMPAGSDGDEAGPARAGTPNGRGPTIALSSPLTEKPGDRIGRYKLLQQIGEGGCGVVYMAEQEQPIRRRVALKVIKLGMDTKQVIARFEAERQALALMDHPNIAKVLDAGATESPLPASGHPLPSDGRGAGGEGCPDLSVGRPYFVMELVRGIKITDYCDQNNLSTEERLDLFVQICHAIQHAHQKGIIHRDIKPSNILVTVHDGKPLPKIIDFGIAKATSGQLLTDKTLFTAFEQFIGTPAYMSPEQAEMSALDIDTRSDIYALGVLLYELLTGQTPFDAQELVSAGLNEMRRIIREQEPVRPSTRISTLAAADQTTVAKRRHAEPPQLIHLVRGDLDWIVMKCLEKDRTRRYETVNGLADDVLRHLNSEPVAARPPSRLYRFQKLVRRNKLVFAATGAVVLALLLGFIVSAWQAVRAKRAEALALQTRSKAEKLSNFILDDFYGVLEPSGQYETVARLARQAVAYYDSLPASLRTADTARNRAAAQARLALATARQGDVKSAMPLAEEAEATLEQMRKQGDQSEGTIFALGLALEAQAWCDWHQADYPCAGRPLQKGVEAVRSFATSANGSRRVKLEYANLLNLLGLTQPPEQGMVTCEEALHILAGLGALDLSDLSVASAWADVADSEARLALDLGQVDEAERLEKQVQTLAEAVLARRPADLRVRAGLCWVPFMQARVEAIRFRDDAALQLATKSRQAAQDYLRFNPSDAAGWANLAGTDLLISSLLFREGRVAEALQTLRGATQSDRDPGNTFNSVLGIVAMSLEIARWEAQRGNRDAADQALQEARHIYESISTRHSASEVLIQRWTVFYEATERQVRLAFDDDATVYTMSTNAVPRLDKLWGGMANRNARVALLNLEREALEQAARAALNLGRHTEAETTAQALLSLSAETGESSAFSFLAQPFDLVWGLVLLAQAQVEQGRNAEALKALEPALAHYRDSHAKGAAHVTFRQHFARALYVQALAESVDNVGTAPARESLDQALALLHGLSDEARQLHDSKELLSWIASAEKKLTGVNRMEAPTQDR